MSFRPAGYSDEEDEDDDEFMYGFSYNDNFDSRRHNNVDFVTEIESDESILYTAVNNGDLEKMKSVISKGFNVDEPLNGGWTALMYACSLGSFSVVNFLIEAKANVNFNKELFTPLMALCKSSSTNKEELNQCMNILVQNGANINATDRNACTALMYACISGHLKLINTLVDLNCDVNIQDVEGWSALFHAIANGGREDIIQILIEGRARVDLIDRRKRSPYDLAMLKGFEHLKQLVCSKKERRKLEVQEEVLPVSENNINDPIDEILAQLPTTNGITKSGYSSDVNKLLWAMSMGHYGKKFTNNSIQLNEFLLITDDKLKKLGVRFSVHRQHILNSIRAFVVHPWNKASLGMKPRNQQMSIEDGVRLLCNITKHLHVINATVDYVTIHQPHPMSVVDIHKTIESAVHQLNLINGELSAISSFSTRLKQKEKMEPVDLIKPKKHSKDCTVYIFTSTMLVCCYLLLWKRKMS